MNQDRVEDLLDQKRSEDVSRMRIRNHQYMLPNNSMDGISGDDLPFDTGMPIHYNFGANEASVWDTEEERQEYSVEHANMLKKRTEAKKDRKERAKLLKYFKKKNVTPDERGYDDIYYFKKQFFDTLSWTNVKRRFGYYYQLKRQITKQKAGTPWDESLSVGKFCQVHR